MVRVIDAEVRRLERADRLRAMATSPSHIYTLFLSRAAKEGATRDLGFMLRIQTRALDPDTIFLFAAEGGNEEVFALLTRVFMNQYGSQAGWASAMTMAAHTARLSGHAALADRIERSL
jgi:hypothetical protein